MILFTITVIILCVGKIFNFLNSTLSVTELISKGPQTHYMLNKYLLNQILKVLGFYHHSFFILTVYRYKTTQGIFSKGTTEKVEHNSFRAHDLQRFVFLLQIWLGCKFSQDDNSLKHLLTSLLLCLHVGWGSISWRQQWLVESLHDDFDLLRPFKMSSSFFTSMMWLLLIWREWLATRTPVDRKWAPVTHICHFCDLILLIIQLLHINFYF